MAATSDSPAAAASPLDIAERARKWSLDVDRLIGSAQQVDRTGLFFALAIAAVAGLSGGVAILVMGGRVQPAPNPLWAFAFGLGSLAGLAVVWKGPASASGWVSTALVAAIALVSLGGAWSNGMLPLYSYAAVIAFLHIVARPALALWVTVGILTGALTLIALRHPVENPALLMRTLIGIVASLLFWQLVSRFWRGWSLRVRDLGREMTEAVVNLDEQRRLLERSARTALTTDPATGLPNRQGFVEALKAELESGSPSAQGTADAAGVVIAIRLPQWSQSTTHRDVASQEQLLRALVARLREVLGTEALLARCDTDEFLAWLPASPSTLESKVDQWVVRSRQLEAAVTAGVTAAPTQPRIGMSCVPGDGSDAATLVRHAELASLAAVRLRSLVPTRFNPSLLAQAEDRDRLMRDAAQGLARGEFHLHYQPLVETRGGPLHKAEALIRWQHPQRGWLSPGVFIPLAEETGLIIDLTDWVLREATRQAEVWRRTLHPEFQVSVNMPPAYLTLCVTEPARMLERLGTLKVPPGAIVLEITEGAMLEVTVELRQVLSVLRGLGFQIALDDFGVGYSSFGQLDKLEINFLKLDKSFVDDLGERPERCAICHAMVSMAHQLGIQVVAEGVETQRQREELERMGTDFLQGYFFSKPLAPAAFESWAGLQALPAP